MIYSLSSEVIHGSPFGASFFYSAHLQGEHTTEAFVAGTVRQLEEILIALLHAGCGYLAAFFEKQKIHSAVRAEEKLFNRLMSLSTKPAADFPFPLPH
ncbi:hypothetical protein C7R54_14535 [Achromobacter aloeverae]|uniref:Uncharacterized protein n=1 Tax=Achromobacter aloeverae TaxID=1750518 RepID=A0A4V1MS06_9BURK|nr:hypothetical protein C7R54_14535 [Achromobacter aloeverae]